MHISPQKRDLIGVENDDLQEYENAQLHEGEGAVRGGMGRQDANALFQEGDILGLNVEGGNAIQTWGNSNIVTQVMSPSPGFCLFEEPHVDQARCIIRLHRRAGKCHVSGRLDASVGGIWY